MGQIYQQHHFADADSNLFCIDVHDENKDTWQSEIKEGWHVIPNSLAQRPSPYHVLENYNKWVISDVDMKQQLEDFISTSKSTIDLRAAEIYQSKNQFMSEYEQREKEVTLARDRGKNENGEYPELTAEDYRFIKHFQVASGMTFTQSVDLIRQQTTQLRGALEQLSALRMSKNLLNDVNTLEQAQAIASDILGKIKQIKEALA